MRKLILIAAAFLALIVYAVVREKNTSSEPVYCKYVKNISSSFIASADKKYGIKYCGSGGALMDRVNIISLSFQSDENNMNIERARVLMVNCVEDYLSRVNANEEIRPYLSHFPFTVSGINIDVSFQEPGTEAIRLVFLSDGNIVYAVKDPDRVPLVRKHKETYEEARGIVMAERGQRALRSCFARGLGYCLRDRRCRRSSPCSGSRSLA